jgi:hypothetical protein
VFVVALDVTSPPGAPFRPGPLPRRWERENVVVATADRRATYSERRLIPLLWDAEVRWHREFDQPPVAPDGFRLAAVEVVRLSPAMARSLKSLRTPAPANAVALLHGELPDVPARELPGVLENTADLDGHHRNNHSTWIAGLLPAGSRISPAEREAVHGTLITAAPDALPRLRDEAAPSGWEPADEWLWAMYHASANRPGRDAHTRLETLRVSLPGRVRCLAGQRGISLVGTDADTGEGLDPRSPRYYYNGASFHLATLYADTLALARLQHFVVAALGAEITRIAERVPRRADVARLERDLLVFRRTYRAAGFGRQEAVDRMGRAWQRDNRIGEALEEITDDLAELSRQVQGAEAESTNAILGLLAAFGLPLGAGLAIWQGLPSAGVWPLCWTLLATVLAAGGLMTAFPGLRSLLGVLRGRRDRR